MAKISSKETYKEGCDVIYMYCSKNNYLPSHYQVFHLQKAIDSD